MSLCNSHHEIPLNCVTSLSRHPHLWIRCGVSIYVYIAMVWLPDPLLAQSIPSYLGESPNGLSYIYAHKAVCHILPFLPKTHFLTSILQQADPRSCIHIPVPVLEFCHWEDFRVHTKLSEILVVPNATSLRCQSREKILCICFVSA